MAKKKKKTSSSASNPPDAGEAEYEVANAEQLPDLQPEDPMGMYVEPNSVERTDTDWGAWRHWAHRNKRTIYAVFAVTIIGSFVYTMIGYEANPYRNIATSYFDRFRSATDDWVYAIGPFQVDENQLAARYSVLTRYTWGDRGAVPLKNDRDMYAGFLNDQLETDLLVNAALADTKLLDSPEARIILENSLRHAIAEYYLFSLIRTEESDFRVEVTQGEVDEHYNRFRQYYTSLNLDKERATPVIRRTLTNLKQDAVRGELGRVRQEVIDRLKDSSGYRVKDPERLR